MQMHCSSLETIDWHVTHTTINTGLETTQTFVAVELSRLTQKTIPQHLVAESCTVCHSWS